MLHITGDGFYLNGEKHSKLTGRSAFKLPSILTYHFKGNGGGDLGWNSTGYVERWIEKQQRLFGEHVVLRVFHETQGWDPQANSMFGIPPQDQGSWWVPALRNGSRETSVHPVAAQTLEWMYQKSEETGVAFEVVIDATMKHNDIPAGEIDHVIRQVGLLMGQLNKKYPKSLIIPNCRNEWNAHNESRHSLSAVNMWAYRWARDKYTEPWMRPVVCPGGGDEFTYEVGPEASKFAMGLIHPDRQPDNRNWWQLPDMNKLYRDARGMPVGFNESMYYVEYRDRQRAKSWYRNPDGLTYDFDHYVEFAEAAIQATDYFVFHDEYGVCLDVNKTGESKLEAYFGNAAPPEPPPPEPPPPSTLWSAVEINERRTVIERRPEVRKGIMQTDKVLRESFTYKANGKRLLGAWTFLGCDPGDRLEFDIHVYADNVPIAKTSPHKPWSMDYDAFKWHLNQQYPYEVDEIRVDVVCNVTGENKITPRPEGSDTARPHFSVDLIWSV